MQTKEKAEIIAEACRLNPTMPTLMLARMVYRARRHLWPNPEAVRTAIRYRRGNQGAPNRKVAINTAPDLVRPNGSPADRYEFPRSSAPDYAPVPLQAERTLILSDLHIPFHDRPAVEVVIARARTRNPDCILLNGDVCDFFSISRFDKNPTESSLKKELDLTRQFLGWLRQEFPKAQIIYKLGNHDEWFDKYLWRKAPELFGVAGVDLPHLVTAKIGTLPAVERIEWVTDQRKITAGKLNIWHGHEIGKGSIAPPVNPARGLFMRTLECGLMGHLHKDSMHTETSAGGKLIACWSTGCLCGMWPRYARVNKWTHSAAFLLLDRGQFSVEPWRVLRGQIL
jgi:predicted phosphodiesterase